MTEEDPQPLMSWALFSLALLSALKVAMIDTFMRDVDVDMDCPCSSSWQSFEGFAGGPLFRTFRSRGGDEFFFFCKYSRWHNHLRCAPKQHHVLEI